MANDWNLNSNIAIPNGTRLVVVEANEVRAIPGDADSVIELRTILELRSNSASNRLYGRYQISTRNSAGGVPDSDRIRLRPTAPGDPDIFAAGMDISDVLHVQRNQLSLPTGLTVALAAWRSGSTGGGGRRGALLTALSTGGGNLGQIDASLAGTVG